MFSACAIATCFLPFRLSAGCSKEAPAPQRPAPQVTVDHRGAEDHSAAHDFVAQTESSRQVDIVARVSGYPRPHRLSRGRAGEGGPAAVPARSRSRSRRSSTRRKGELGAEGAPRDGQGEPRPRQAARRAGRAAAAPTSIGRKGELDAANAAVFSASAKVRRPSSTSATPRSARRCTGVASRSLQRQGAYVNSLADSAQLTNVAALDPIWVNFSVSQNQMAR